MAINDKTDARRPTNSASFSSLARGAKPPALMTWRKLASAPLGPQAHRGSGPGKAKLLEAIEPPVKFLGVPAEL